MLVHQLVDRYDNRQLHKLIVMQLGMKRNFILILEATAHVFVIHLLNIYLHERLLLCVSEIKQN